MAKLKEWLDGKKKRRADMARDFGVKHCVIRRWCAGENMPSPENMQKIFAYTGGEVTPNDFYNINELEKELTNE